MGGCNLPNPPPLRPPVLKRASPVPHAWIPEGLDEGNVWAEVFNTLLDFLCYIKTTHRALDGTEVFDTLVDGPVCVVDVVG